MNTLTASINDWSIGNAHCACVARYHLDIWRIWDLLLIWSVKHYSSERHVKRLKFYLELRWSKNCVCRGADTNYTFSPLPSCRCWETFDPRAFFFLFQKQFLSVSLFFKENERMKYFFFYLFYFMHSNFDAFSRRNGKWGIKIAPNMKVPQFLKRPECIERHIRIR